MGFKARRKAQCPAFPRATHEMASFQNCADVSGDDSSQVVRSVILTRAGLEESVRAGAPVQDMVRGVPADLFRTCLARVRAFTFFPLPCTGLYLQLVCRTHLDSFGRKSM